MCVCGHCAVCLPRGLVPDWAQMPDTGYRGYRPLRSPASERSPVTETRVQHVSLSREKLSALQIYSHLLSRAVHFISSVHQVSHLIWFVHSKRGWRIDLSPRTLSCEYQVVSNSYITRHNLFIRFLLILIIIAAKYPDHDCFLSRLRLRVRQTNVSMSGVLFPLSSLVSWWYPHYPLAPTEERGYVGSSALPQS